MENKFHYDDFSDSMIISGKQENEIVKSNFEIGDIIFSLTGKGKIVSIEIREFSSFIEACNVSSEILSNLKNIQFSVVPKNKSLFLLLKIESQKGQTLLLNNIPLVVPLMAH
ncbi:MAG: hypothetical protein KKB21_00375 [Nanoarchaeota archaeon]|nr:hypothetical protein [Nanoarchaeota archaeon]